MSMAFKVIKRKEDSDTSETKLVVDFLNIDTAVVNSIRRVILSEIPNVAIAFDPYSEELSDIQFMKNTSSLHNEFMGHRISLIPVLVQPEKIPEYDPKKYRFVIDVHNQGTDIIDVTTDDIKVMDESNEHNEKMHGILFPKNSITKDPILITQLKPNLYNKEHGEHLHVEFKSRVGKAKDHARYSPVSTCTYYNVVDDAAADEALKELIAQQEAKAKDGHVMTKAEKEALKKRFNVHERYRFFKKNEYDEPNAMRFTIESECRMTPVYLVDKAIDILIEKCMRLVEDTENALNVKVIDEETNAFAVTIYNEDHTLGNLLQSLIYNARIRDNDGKLAYIGYYHPHPLVHEIVIKLIFNGNAAIRSEDLAQEYFLESIQECVVKKLNEIKKTWRATVVDVVEAPVVTRIKARGTRTKNDKPR